MGEIWQFQSFKNLFLPYLSSAVVYDLHIHSKIEIPMYVAAIKISWDVQKMIETWHLGPWWSWVLRRYFCNYNDLSSTLIGEYQLIRHHWKHDVVFFIKTFNFQYSQDVLVCGFLCECWISKPLFQSDGQRLKNVKHTINYHNNSSSAHHYYFF